MMGKTHGPRPWVPGRKLRRALARFRRNQDGSATVESVIWMVAFFGLIILVSDASLAFFGKAQAFRALQDGNRAYAIGYLATANEVKAWIEAEMELVAPTAEATTEVTEVDGVDRLVSSSLEIPISDLTLFSSFDTVNIVVRSQHYVEWDR